ncbi:MAG TPA: hypothetical protein VGZ28_00305 [Terriglobales bacterium]|jgi:hypothetical protein|nr:hypothetical protein [Terriglobales bacterium]
MRRRLAIAALCAAVLLVPLQAQMRSAPRGSAPMGRGGISTRGPVGFRSGSGLAASPRFGVGFATGARFGSRVGFSTGFRRPFFGPPRFHNRFFFNTAPWFFSYYGYPAYYGGYSYSVLDSYPAYDSSAVYNVPAPYSPQNDIARQQEDIDRLEDEVARLREERDASDLAQRPPAERKSEPAAPTLLVFRDKHTQEVQNYAIVGQTLWIFSEQRATRLPLSVLDIDATAKANEERGLEFQIPQ